MIGDDVEVTLLAAAGGKARLGIQAPADVPVYRTEIYVEIHQENGAGGDRGELGSDVGALLRELDGSPERR